MKYLAVLVVLFFFAPVAESDTIELKTGERIEGAFKQAASAGAVIEVAGQSITIPLEKVRAIYFGVAPSVSGAAPTPLQEAMDSLKALRSVTGSGIAYRDYAQRVLEARVKVDRYLSSPAPDTDVELRKTIDLTMKEYELASNLWNVKIRDEAFAVAKKFGEGILKVPELLHCPSIQNYTTAGRAAYRDGRGQQHPAVPPSKLFQEPNPEPVIVGLTLVNESPAIIWPCASSQLAEAELLVAKH